MPNYCKATGKKKYSRFGANYAIKKILHKYKKDKKEEYLQIYKCRYCDTWHLGRIPIDNKQRLLQYKKKKETLKKEYR